ncbi:MAG TPA: dihydrofolate reductase family protein [Propionibacteriaceae bacterium]|jgi:dihydrofolate reductase
MGRLVYASITSLDGYVADEQGAFDWSAPDEEVHAFVNDLQRPVGTYLYGRRLYETMVAWETMPTAGEPPVIQDFATIWRTADKVVYSTTLTTVSSARTRVERRFDVAEVERLKASATTELVVGGPTLAATALREGLVDEIHQLMSPVVVGGGRRLLPDGLRLQLELLDQRRFGNGVVYLRYGIRR